MYNRFFGFKERPFNLVPNPRYLYLSRSHEEALAYLNFAIRQGDGFVEITGEVGTGKTTLCREFLSNLDKNVEVALIFNPKLNALDLLKSINDEFGIDATADTIKTLIDHLNAFLLKKKENGQKAVLLIDEAHNLSHEVLEQIRLISNLETTQEKLIQIILVGQPELATMLRSHSLRQLGQRISLSCRLEPLTFHETVYYIRHRLETAASQAPPVFENRAIKRIHRYTEGIPRRINIICERCLLAAYSLNSRMITTRIAQTAIHEIETQNTVKKSSLFSLRYPGRFLAISIALLVVGILLDYSYQAVQSNGRLFSFDSNSEKKSGTGNQISTPLPTETPDEVKRLTEMTTAPPLLPNQDHPNSRCYAISVILDAWGQHNDISPEISNIADDKAFFDIVARRNGLSLLHLVLDWEKLANMRLPGILIFKPQDGKKPVYLAYTALCGDQIRFHNFRDDAPVTIRHDEVMQWWNGDVMIPWRNFYNYPSVIYNGSPADAVIAMKIHLAKIGYAQLTISPQYDAETEAVIKTFQIKKGIDDDGQVGPVTQIMLYNQLPELGIPFIDGGCDHRE